MITHIIVRVLVQTGETRFLQALMEFQIEHFVTEGESRANKRKLGGGDSTELGGGGQR